MTCRLDQTWHPDLNRAESSSRAAPNSNVRRSATAPPLFSSTAHCRSLTMQYLSQNSSASPQERPTISAFRCLSAAESTLRNEPSRGTSYDQPGRRPGKSSSAMDIPEFCNRIQFERIALRAAMCQRPQKRQASPSISENSFNARVPRRRMEIGEAPAALGYTTERISNARESGEGFSPRAQSSSSHNDLAALI